jgi:ABC-type glutathione transport system ATPase component
MTEIKDLKSNQAATYSQVDEIGIVVADTSGVTMEDFSGRETVFNLEKVSVYYGSALAVNEVSLDIYKNQITAFIGPSGCGKTTILRCLNE